MLALDTSTPHTSVAFESPEGLWEACDDGQRQTEVILPLIDRVLRAQTLDGVVVSHGPGAFSGLRVGTAVGIGLALARAVPLYSLSSLALLAATAGRKYHQPGRVLALLDARMNELYCGDYVLDAAGQVHALGADVLCKPEDLRYPEDLRLLVGPGVACLPHRPSGVLCDGELYPQAAAAFAARNLWTLHEDHTVALHYLRDNVTG